ncbi:MAG: PEP-CTERM sorting domain-containing protein [Akkermansiaceae bacterium]
MNKSLITLLTVTAATAAWTNAATLAWTDSAFTNANQISNAGTQVAGYNFGTATSVTVNGATFTGYSGAGAFTGSNFQPGNNSIIGDFNPAYSGNNVTGMLAADELALLNNANYANNGELTEFSGLTIGTQYTAQLLLVDNRSSFTTRNMHISKDSTTWGDLVVDYSSNGTPAYARLVETTFTADGTEQGFRWGIQNIGDYEGVALQLRAVPEPSSSALLALGGIALLRRRR